MNFDWTALALVSAAVIAWAMLLMAVFAWREALAERMRLPLWRFVRRSGIGRQEALDTAGKGAALHAELKCALCSGKARCCGHLGAGAQPTGSCPNRAFLDQLGSRRPLT
jgi:hypothetical protein